MTTRPGSTLFQVWSQFRDDRPVPGDLGYDRQLDQLFGAEAEDMVLLKVSKWFSP